MKKYKISQSALARGTGVPQPTINRLLNNKIIEPRRDSVVRIATFFGVTPESLYEIDDIKNLKSSLGSPIDEIYRKIAMLSVKERVGLFERVSANLK